MRAVHVLLSLALLCMVVSPLRRDLASWAWSWWLIAALVAGALALTRGFSPRRHLQKWVALAAPAVGCLLVACLIDAALGLWHGEELIILRQDGKVLLALPMVWAVMSIMSLHHTASVTAPGLLASGFTLREALGWAIGLQMVVAAVVAIQWPRAWLPATPIPWATGVALGMAVLAPLALAKTSEAPNSAAWRVGLGLAVLAGAVAVVLSRSRAAWIILPWLGVLWVVFAQRRGWATAGVLLTGVAALGAGLWYDSLQPVQVERGVRLLDMMEELRQLQQPDASTSVGSRLLLWDAAWNSLWQHPWTGIGIAERMALVQQIVPPEQMRDVAPLVHVHQQFLNQAVDHGLPGLLASLLCAAAPFALAWRAFPGAMRWQCLGVGVVHAVGLMFNANMTHGTYAMTYALSMMAIVGLHAQAMWEDAPHD